MKLHLGCGKRYIPGFVHVDLAGFSHVDYYHDVRTLPMFDDDSVDLVYACHVLEYFDRVEAVEVLKEWRRVLKVGGIVRLAVPDLGALAEIYYIHRNDALIIGPLYGRMVITSPCGVEHTIYHRTAYDFASLTRVLEDAEFSKVRRYNWRDTEHSDTDDFASAYIPHLEKEYGRLISLNVEATKP